MSDQEHDVIADFAAQATNSVGLPDDVGLDQALPDELCDAVDDYAEDSERRYGHLAEGIDDPDAEPEQEEPTQRGDKTVPLGALQEERNLRKQSQDRERELQAQVAQLQAFQQQVQAYLAQQQQAEQQVDFSDDPEKFVTQLQQQVQQLQAAQQQQLQEQQAVAHVRAEASAIAPVAAQSEAAMAAEVGQETYSAAFEHVRQHVQQELMQRFPGVSPQGLATLETAASIQFIKQCQQMGIDPARHIYEKAQSLGFTPPGQRVPNQQRKAPPTSLSTVPAAGRAPDQRGRLTAKDIASMPQDEFDKLFDSMRDEQRPQF